MIDYKLKYETLKNSRNLVVNIIKNSSKLEYEIKNMRLELEKYKDENAKLKLQIENDRKQFLESAYGLNKQIDIFRKLTIKYSKELEIAKDKINTLSNQ